MDDDVELLLRLFDHNDFSLINENYVHIAKKNGTRRYATYGCTDTGPLLNW